MNKDNNAVFHINNILLSAYSEDKDFCSKLSEENDKLKEYVTKELQDEYILVKKGTPFTLPEKEAPRKERAVLYVQNNQPARAFWEFVRLWKKSPKDIGLMKNIVSSLLVIKAYKAILEYFEKPFLEYMEKDFEVMHLLAAAYFSSQENYDKALPLYEKLIEKYPKNPQFYYHLAFCYERVYQDKYLDKQVMYARKSEELYDKNNVLLVFLGKILYRAGEKEECFKCFEKAMANNPSPEDIVAYSRILMMEGDITKGYDLYRCRFDTGIVSYPKLLTPDKRWDGKSDLSDSTVIVHYEQGFGDSVMFSRYIPEIAKIAKKVIFVVQKNLIPIFKSSGYDRYCEILSHEADVNPNIKLDNTNRSVMYSGGSGMAKIPHDYHIPLMDTPFLFKESPDKMAQASGYLSANQDKVIEFREKYINKNSKIKVGLSYHGTKDSILTYRDISVKRFLPLLKMEGVEFYSFQSDEYANELQELDKTIKITDLGKVFKDFEDTACAMNCMDVIISTDNVVMNLAGALGVKTYALFNKYVESRWYQVDGDDIGWYKSVRPFHAKTFNDWDNLILDVKSALEKDFNL